MPRKSKAKQSTSKPNACTLCGRGVGDEQSVGYLVVKKRRIGPFHVRCMMDRQRTVRDEQPTLTDAQAQKQVIAEIKAKSGVV